MEATKSQVVWFDIPCSDLDRAIRSNVKELREQYVRDAAGQWVADVEEELNWQLIAQVDAWAGAFAEFQLADALRPDLEARSQVYQRMQQVMTIDEIRDRENLPRLNMDAIERMIHRDSLPLLGLA